MSLSPEQIAALSNLAESLKGSSLSDFVLSAANQAIKSAKPENPAVPDKAITPSNDQKEVLDSLSDTTKPAAASPSVYLAPHAKNYIQREINATGSTFVPILLKFFFCVNILDMTLSDNFYARRSLPFMYPSLSRIYFAVLIHYQLLRVARYCKDITPEAAAFLDTLEDAYPPATLAIPGPLLPFFQALCSSIPENKRFRRVFPKHPQDWIDDTLPTCDRAAQNAAANTRDWYLPYIPYLVNMHHTLMTAFPGVITFGADDSHNAGNKTVALVPIPGYDHIAQVLHHPRAATRNVYFPFAVTNSVNHVVNATANIYRAATTTILGTDIGRPMSDMTNDGAEMITKCGLAEPFNVHKDLTNQFVQNFSRLPIPEVDMNDYIDTWAASFCMEDSMHWFAELAASMSAYATFFPGSGTLEDAKLEGPRVGQYVCAIQAPRVAIARPLHYGQGSSIHNFASRLSTTVNEEETITELLAHYTQINSRMYAAHPWLGNLGSAARRHGDFWTIRPLYQNGTTDEAWIQFPQTIKSTVLERPGKKE